MSDSSIFRDLDSQSTTVDEMFCQAATKILLLVVDVARCRATAEFFCDVERVLTSLPLAADEYALATCRVRNSRNYYESGQLGAALYELRLLAGRLRHRR